MAEEQFTSRRARREAERLAAEQEFEARSTPAQPKETNRADLLFPPQRPTVKPSTPAETAPPAATHKSAPGMAEPSASAKAERPASARPATTGPSAPSAKTGPSAPPGRTEAPAAPEAPAKPEASRIDAAPAPQVAHERGALASDHPQQERPPVNAEDLLDPRRAPLPHFESRAARKRYLREHGLSMDGDLSTGALPVIAEPESESDSPAAGEPAGASGPGAGEHESFDSAGFGGSTDEVAKREFESPVTPDSAPRPVSGSDTRAGEPDDALSRPLSSLEDPATPGASPRPAQGSAQADGSGSSADPASPKDGAKPKDPGTSPAPAEESPAASRSSDSDDADTPEPPTRSRRMPVVQPPTTSGVRVVTAASAQVTETSTSTSAPNAPSGAVSAPESDARSTRDDGAASDEESARSADDAARALAANPETRPMDAVPEAWALPNSDYEDEETENPPGDRIRASSVTGHDGQILVGEEPSKVPFIVLGVAALFALALIVIALVMLL